MEVEAGDSVEVEARDSVEVEAGDREREDEKQKIAWWPKLRDGGLLKGRRD